MDRLIELVRAHVYVGLFATAFIDATGVPFPGRLLIIAMGAFAAGADVNVAAMIAAAALGAIAGDHLWYFAGRLRGEQILGLYCRVLPRTQHCVSRAREYIARFGALAFVVGRFVGGVRILAAPVASAGGVGYGKFLAFDVGGALLWSSAFTLLGYAVGAQAPALLGRYGFTGQLVIGAVVTAAALGFAWLVRRLSRSPRGAPRPARGRRPRRAA
jgi:membrane protein DedA with SNARE-associated domain